MAETISDRLAAIALLLRGRNDDDLPGASTLQLASKPGPAPSGRIPCSCASLRVVLFTDSECCPPGCRAAHRHLRHKQRYELAGHPRCTTCEASGWRRRFAYLDGKSTSDDRGDVFDEYVYAHDHAVSTKKARSLPAQRKGVMTERELGLALDRLAAQWPVLRDAEQEQRFRERDAYGWEVRRDRHFASGSFRELERALDELRLHDELLHRKVRFGVPPPMAGLLFLSDRMPAVIRVPQALKDQAQGERRQESVLEVYAETKSLTKTAFRTRTPRVKVRVILRKAGVLSAASG